MSKKVQKALSLINFRIDKNERLLKMIQSGEVENEQIFLSETIKKGLIQMDNIKNILEGE